MTIEEQKHDLKQKNLEFEYEKLINAYIKPAPEEIERFWLRNTDIEARIESINDNGLMKIKFSRNITVHNITQVNPSVLKIELIPHHKHTNLTKLFFTYNCTVFMPDYLLL